MNMKKVLKAVALFAVPMLSVASCGGIDDIFGSDGGTMVCAAGTTLYSVASPYATVTASNIQDGCNEGLTASALQGGRQIQYTDMTNGIITVTSSSSGTLLGTGPVRCNMGDLSYGPMTVANSSCSWTTTRSVHVTVTGNYQVTLDVKDDRTGTAQVAGGATCQQPATCTTRFSLAMAK